MSKIIEGRLLGEGKKFGIVVSRFNDFITDKLLDGALDVLRRHAVKDSDIDIVKSPGSFEIPVIAQKLVKSKKYDAIICLGTVIRGATSHYEYVAAQAAKGIAQVALSSEKPVSFGIITAENLEQAIERAGTKHGNKGASAAMSALEMVNLWQELKSLK